MTVTPPAGHRHSREYIVAACRALPLVVERSIHPGHLFPCGGTGDNRVLVVSGGAVALQSEAGPSGARVYEVLGPGGVVCSERLFDDAPNPAPCVLRALRPSKVLSMPRQGLVDALRADGRLALALTQRLADQYGNLLGRLNAVTSRAPVVRVADVLFCLSHEIGEQCPLAPGNHLSLAQHPLADLTGLSRQTANRALARLTRARLVLVRRGFICLVDPVGMQRVALTGQVPPATDPVAGCKLRQPALPLACLPRDATSKHRIS